ncbi:MAG: ABC transporter substrate-binding protein [Propionibacteriaceae bacterium]|jgi:ABC-type branched-subunit amino acid transport system substrate-binding protein|nr:ABC transporter substrate-binding protein [Propionibacteriaceae bacterium]
MKTKQVLATLTGILLSASWLAGCAGDSPDNTDATDATTTDSPVGTVQGISATEVHIANSAATSGAYATVGVPFLAGLEGYIEMVNQAGGIDGRQIVFTHTDDEFDPAKGSAALTEFVEDDKVFAIVGHFGTPVVAATIDQLKEYGIPSVYFATGIGQLYADHATTNAEGYNIFPVQPIYRVEGSLMVAYATSTFAASKIGIIYTNDDAGMDLRTGAIEQIDKLDGVTYAEAQVPAGAADVSAAVTSIKNAEVDFIIVASIQQTMPTIVKELAAQGVNKDCITTYVNVSLSNSEAVIADIQDKFDVYGLHWVDYASQIAQDTLVDYQAQVDAEYAMNPYAQTGWIAGVFFTEGLRRLVGQEVTWESYMQALEQAPIQNPFGGVIDYANGSRLGTQEMGLSRIVPVSDPWPAGWEVVEPLQSVDALLNH